MPAAAGRSPCTSGRPADTVTAREAGRRPRPAPRGSSRARAAGNAPDPDPGLPPALILHFAYGGNMDPAVLARRGVRPAWCMPAVARGARLEFNHRSAFANLTRLEEGEVGDESDGAHPSWPVAPHGVLYGLTPGDWESLVAAEAGYGVRGVRVVTYSGDGAPSSGRSGGGGREAPAAAAARPPPGSTLTAAAFISSPWATLRAGSLPPRRVYLEKLISGARARGVDAVYIAWLRALPTADVGGKGLPAAYVRTPGQDAVVISALGLAGGLLAWALGGGLM